MARFHPLYVIPRIGVLAIAPAVICVVSLASLGLRAPAAWAAEEGCPSCKYQVSIKGDFTHRKDNAAVALEGAGNDAAAFREEITGKAFTVSIAHLPAGKYTVTIGEAETLVKEPNERVFDVTFESATVVANFDIVAAAGGTRKVCTLTQVVEHQDDSLRGPLTVSFEARKNAAKFNTFEVKNAAGESVVAFTASELADAFSAAATRVPEVTEPPIWRDPSQPLRTRAERSDPSHVAGREGRPVAERGARNPAARPCRPTTTGTRRCMAWPTTGSPRSFRSPSAWPPPGIRN